MPFFASFTQSTKVFGLLQQLRTGAATIISNVTLTFANTSSWIVPDGVTVVDYLVIGGGGGGGSFGGGGGAGGYRTGTGYGVTSAQTFTIIVGAGGVGATTSRHRYCWKLMEQIRDFYINHIIVVNWWWRWWHKSWRTKLCWW
jgi:hypothetical protein